MLWTLFVRVGGHRLCSSDFNGRDFFFVKKAPKCSKLWLTPEEPFAPVTSDAPPSVPPIRFCDFGSSRDLEYPDC